MPDGHARRRLSESRNPCPPLDFCRACRRGAQSFPIHAGEGTNPGRGRQKSSKVAIWRRHFGCRKYCRWHNIPKIGRRRESSFPALPAAAQRVPNRCMHRCVVRLEGIAACNGVCEEGVANGTAPMLSNRGLILPLFRPRTRNLCDRQSYLSSFRNSFLRGRELNRRSTGETKRAPNGYFP